MWTNDIRFMAGKLNAIPDLLSRPGPHLLGEAYKMETDSDLAALSTEKDLAALSTVAFNVVDPTSLAKGQLDCPDVQAHRSGLHAAGLNLQDYEFSPGVTLLCDISNGKKARPLVPKPWRDLIIRMFHSLAHPGQKETLKRVSARYYWPGIKEDVSTYVKACSCQAVKTHKHIAIPPAHRIVPARRFSQLMLDVVGPLPTSPDGLCYLLTIIDRTSRFVQAVPMTAATADTCARAFLEGWVAFFGLCEEVITDNGNTFVANVWSKLHEMLGTIVSYTPTYHSASLGHLERQHRDIKQGLRACLMEMGDQHGTKWPQALPWVLLHKRVAFQPDLGASPAELVFGDVLTIPGDLTGAHLEKDSSLPHLLDRLRKNAARAPVQTSHHAQPKENIPADIETATHVYVKKPKPCPLGRKYDGPLFITSREGNSCIKVRRGYYANGKPREDLIHWDNAKPAYFLDEPFTNEGPSLGRPKKEIGRAKDN